MRLFLSFLLCSAITYTKAQEAYKPSHQELIASYKRSAMLDTTVSKKVFHSSVRPNWAPDGKSFWYRVSTGFNTSEFTLVNLTTNKKAVAFDHQKLAIAFNKLTKKSIKSTNLPIEDMIIKPGQSQVMFLSNKVWYDWNNGELKVMTTAPKIVVDPAERWRRRNNGSRDFVSPDKKHTAYIKDGNIYVKSDGIKEDIQLTTDGKTGEEYGRMSWSPDSKNLVGYKIDVKEVKKVYYILSSQPDTFRGELKSQDYMQPGDDFTSFEMHVFDIQNKTDKKVAIDKIDFFGPPQLHWRKGDNNKFTFERRDRGHQRFRVIEVNAKTGTTKNIIDEKTNTFIYEQKIFTEYLPESHEIVWATEKDGYRHLYLIDEITGKQKSRITNGNWVVRGIDSVDVKKREVWFSASGMDPKEDPYNVHYYRIGFNGKNLVNLSPAIGNHTVSFSPDKSHYVDTYSQVNVAPVSTLNRSTDGKKVMDVEQTNLDEYMKTGIKLPEVFVAKGRDGKTDIWGIMSVPSTLDSTKTYPVIEYIYAGPQDSFVPKNFLPYSEMQSIAELGFIVIQSDGMGTSNRSKAFHDVCWKNLGDAGFEDRILWIKALAQKHKYIDASRVGIYGTSAGGQNAGGAVLFHPEFYTSAVAACGCHDNRVDKQWWNEQWMGYPVGPHYEAQSNITNAAKLKGNLMLLVGEADTNVPPESTYRFADALIKAGKTFELIVVPGLGHSDGGVFGKNKKRDFFVKTLLNVDAPNRNQEELTKN
jgi:dipeptidyl aminopeptidase/acylaminoacyl peptidase